MPDPSSCTHEWVDDGTLEIFPPVDTAHCVKCGLRRRINTASGEVTYFPLTESSDRSHPVASPSREDGAHKPRGE